MRPSKETRAASNHPSFSTERFGSFCERNTVYPICTIPQKVTILQTNSFINRFHFRLGGILLGYENIVIQSSSGFINNDNCFVHVNVEGDFYVFNPEVGQLLKGTVNKKSRSHVGCLVYELFNVSLPSPEEDEPWLGDTVCLGQEVLFRIINTNLNRKLPYIQGEIV